MSSKKNAVIVMIGQSGMGKSTFINHMARKELAKTGELESVTQDTVKYEFERDGTSYTLFDTAGVMDTRQDQNPTLKDKQILDDLQDAMLDVADADIHFILVQALSEKRIYIPMVTNKYRTIFGNNFLESCLVLGTNFDLPRTDELKAAAVNNVKKQMQQTFNREFLFSVFSSEMDEKDTMVSEALKTLQQAQPFSNEEIKKIKDLVATELKNQKDRSKHSENFEHHSEPYTDTERYPVERVRTVTYQDRERVPTYRDKHFLGIPTGNQALTGFKTVTVDKQRQESYVDYETRNVTRYRDKYKLKYTEEQLLKFAKKEVAKQIKKQTGAR